jgi:uncharacterized RDD family membrane protein YckC
MNRDNSLGTGAYYRMEDYAGFMRRLVVMFVDSTVLIVIGVALWIAILTISGNVDPTYDPSATFFLVWIAIAWLYLVPLKRSRFRTIAYRLLGLMIVTTKGERPSLFTMTFRMLMWVFGPFNFLLDLIWLGADTEGQSLRDCFAGTYVVRNGAEPVGFAPMHLTRYTGAGMALSYPRVCRPKSQERNGG